MGAHHVLDVTAMFDHFPHHHITSQCEVIVLRAAAKKPFEDIEFSPGKPNRFLCFSALYNGCQKKHDSLKLNILSRSLRAKKNPLRFQVFHRYYILVLTAPK